MVKNKMSVQKRKPHSEFIAMFIGIAISCMWIIGIFVIVHGLVYDSINLLAVGVILLTSNGLFHHWYRNLSGYLDDDYQRLPTWFGNDDLCEFCQEYGHVSGCVNCILKKKMFRVVDKIE